MRNKKTLFLLLIIVCMGTVLRFNNLSHRSLWTDEFFTLFQSNGHGIAIKSLLDGFGNNQNQALLKAGDFKKFVKNDPAKNTGDVSLGVIATDTHPPLYFCIMHIWIRAFGDSALTLRLFSVIMGILAIVLAYNVTLCLFDKTSALFSALFMSISAFAVRYSQEARSYSLIMVLGLLSWLFILRFQRDNKKSDAFLFSLSNALGIYTHYFYIFVSIAQFLYFTVVYRNKTKVLRKFYLAFLFSLLLLSPLSTWVILKGYNFHLTEWLFGYPGVISKIYYLLYGVSRFIAIGDSSKIIYRIFFSIQAVLFLYIVARALKPLMLRYRQQSFFCMVMFLLPVSAMFFVDFIEHGALLRQERFWVFSFVGLIPLAGYFLANGFLKNKIVLGIVVFLMLLSSILVAHLQFGPAPKNISSWINRESGHKSAAVIVYNIRSVVFAQAYYLDNDIYLVPVANDGQLKDALRLLFKHVDAVFIVRHYHRSDNTLMNQAFMEKQDIGEQFKLKTTVKEEDISVSEYVKCGS